MPLLAVTLLNALLLLAAVPAPADVTACHIGSYRLGDGGVVDIAPSEGDTLRWRLFTGETGQLHPKAGNSWSSTYGWTGRPDGKTVSFSDCAHDEIRFGGQTGKRIDFDVSDTTFESHDVKLVGRLVLPKGGGRVPVVVLVHGSEHESARELYALQRMFPAQGIGAFVYDKRGTGASGGRYTHDYLLLAEDAVAAAREARRLAAGRAGRLGYLGTSEGGWVAPLAAHLEAVDFAVVAYGLAVSPLDEDREAIALDLTRRGHGPAEVAKAMEIADATAAVLLSGFREGWEGVEAVRARYRAEPWFRWVHGNFTFLLLERPAEELRALGPELLADVPLQHDPLPVLRNLRVPQLWLLGADDLDAPSAETGRRLAALAAAGRPIAALLFPGAEHGLYQYEEGPDGARLSTRLAPGYVQLVCDFAREGRVTRTYGATWLTRVPASPGARPP